MNMFASQDKSRRSRSLALLAATSIFTGTLLSGCLGAAEAAPTGAASSKSALAAAAGKSSSGIVAAAATFAATLDSTQLSALKQKYTFANAQAWSNLPQALSRNRIGLQLSTLKSNQKAALGELLKAASGTKSGEGYDEIQQLLNADDYLAANGGGAEYGSGNYFIAFLGEPSNTGKWELQFGGHHLAFANTYVNGSLVGATPSFRGSEPFGAFEQAGETNAPLASEQLALSAVLKSLSSGQQAAAKLGGSYRDLIMRPGNDWAFPTTREGVKVSTLNSRQQALVLAAIATYVNDIDDADAKTIMAKYTKEIGKTYVAFSGSTSLLQQNDYMRIDGPSVWLEFSMQRGIILAGNHPHSVWRDRITDYGGTRK